MTAPAYIGGPRSRVSIGIIGPPAKTAIRDKTQHRMGVRTMSFQEFFKIRWAIFLKENFRTPEQIGVAFSVSSVTAQNWLDGATGPRGHNVARAFKDFPGEAKRLTKDEAA